jgi:glyoxylate carboligase
VGLLVYRSIKKTLSRRKHAMASPRKKAKPKAAKTAAKTASDLFVEILQREGVEYIYGVPGEENLDFLEALRKSKIQLILTRHEQGAAFMAATYGRLTGKTGVCLATLGPGATNFVTAAAYAQLGGLFERLICRRRLYQISRCHRRDGQ